MPTDDFKSDVTRAISLPVLWLGTQSPTLCNGCQFLHGGASYCELFREPVERETSWHGGSRRSAACKAADVAAT